VPSPSVSLAFAVESAIVVDWLVVSDELESSSDESSELGGRAGGLMPGESLLSEFVVALSLEYAILQRFPV